MQQANGKQAPRGQQGRPDVKAREKIGEERVREILTDRKEDIKALFANDANPQAMFDRAVALSAGAYKKAQADNEKRIDETSMVTGCLWAMQRKLDPGTDVYLVPYFDRDIGACTITPILSPEGVIKLMMRSGFVKDTNWAAVVAGDEFDYQLGTKNDVKHKKTGKRPLAVKAYGKVKENPELWRVLEHAWCVVDLKDGGQTVVVLNKSEIEYYRSLSPSSESAAGPWAKFPDAMACKSALKQAAKRVPKDAEISAILTADESEHGIEIPAEIMQAVGARMVREMIGENPNGAPGSSPGHAPPANNEATTYARSPRAGDPDRLTVSGGKDKPRVPISKADNKSLEYWAARMLSDFTDGKWHGNQYEDSNITTLATIRDELRRRGVAVAPNASLDGQDEPTNELPHEPEYMTEPADMREPGAEG